MTKSTKNIAGFLTGPPPPFTPWRALAAIALSLILARATVLG